MVRCQRTTIGELLEAQAAKHPWPAGGRKGEPVKKWIFCVATLLALCSGVAKANAFDDAGAAYDKGDYAQAIKLWRPMAEKGYAPAQSNLGVTYQNGQGVTQDYREAVKWYRLAAAQGYAGAQFNVGAMYANGRGVPQDHQEAVKWWRLAAAQGLAEAQENLGVLYHHGQGVAQDYQEAVKWLRLAAVRGMHKRNLTLELCMTPAEACHKTIRRQ